MKQLYFWLRVMMLTLLPAGSFGAITIDPPVMFFPETAFGTASQNARFTITNTDTNVSGILGSVSLEGDSSDYEVTFNSCSGNTLQSGSVCYVDVVFTPRANGTRTAMLQFDGSYMVAAFLSNYEDKKSELLRRIPPVLEGLSLEQGGEIVDKTNGIDLQGGPVTIQWSILGYHESYSSVVALFSCAPDNSSGTCGSMYSMNFDASAPLEPDSVTDGEWFYSGIRSKVYGYSYTFDPGVSSLISSGKLILRFYHKSNHEALLNNSSTSLLLPGNLNVDYYDTSGRRLSIGIK